MRLLSICITSYNVIQWYIYTTKFLCKIENNCVNIAGTYVFSQVSTNSDLTPSAVKKVKTSTPQRTLRKGAEAHSATVSKSVNPAKKLEYKLRKRSVWRANRDELFATRHWFTHSFTVLGFVLGSSSLINEVQVTIEYWVFFMTQD